MRSIITSSSLLHKFVFLLVLLLGTSTPSFCKSSPLSSNPTTSSGTNNNNELESKDELIIRHFQQVVADEAKKSDSSNNGLLDHHRQQQQQQQQDNKNLSLEEGLVRLEETSQALTFLLNRIDEEQQEGQNRDTTTNNNDNSLRDLLRKVVGYTQQVKEITIQAAVAASGAVEEQQQHQQQQATSSPVTETATRQKRKLQLRAAAARHHQHYNNKAKRHFQLHDALLLFGEEDDDAPRLLQRLFSTTNNKNNKKFANTVAVSGRSRRRRRRRRNGAARNHRRRQSRRSRELVDSSPKEEEEDDSDDSSDDDNEPGEGSDLECKAVVKCLRDWTILDVMSYFFINEDGDIIDDTSADQLRSKAKRIAKKLSVFPTTEDDSIEDTIDFGPKCNALLSVFDSSAETETDGASTTWKDICDAQPKYVSYKDIKDKFGTDIAISIFEDFILCSSDDIQEVFLDDSVRIPTNYSNGNTDSKDELFEYKEYKIYNQYIVNKMIPGGSDNITTDASTECQDQLDDIYKEMFLEESYNENRIPYIYKKKSFDHDDKGDDLPKLLLNCTRIDAASDWSCGIQAQRQEDDDEKEENLLSTDVNCQMQIRSIVNLSCSEEEEEEGSSATTMTSCQVEMDIDSLFEDAVVEEEEDDDDKKNLLDVATQLLLGQEVSTGLVCKNKGFCCLDQPGDDFTLGLWGSKKFNCDFGESECQNKAPLLSGFSEETCSSLYKGTYCLKPVDCKELLECIEEEKEWAKGNDKMAYHDYLDAGPEVDEISQCGSLREYHGCENDENDRDVCAGIRQLRSNQVFEELDKLSEKHGPRSGQQQQQQQQQQTGNNTTRFGNFNLKLNVPPRQKNQQQVDSMKLGDLDEFSEKFMEPEEPERSEEYLYQKKLGLYQFKQILSTLEETLVVLEVHTCPSDPSFEAHNKCVDTKNVMSAVLVASLFISKRIFQTIEYLYLENDALSDYDLNKMHQTVMTVNGNLDVLAEYASVIRDNQQVLRDNQEVLSNQIKGIGSPGGSASDKNAIGETSSGKIVEKIDGTNSLIADVRVKLKADMVNLNSGTKLQINLKTDEILQKIEKTCSAPSARRQLGVGCTGESLKVMCGLNRKGSIVSEDKKSLHVEESYRKINTGFFYDVKGACSDLVDVSISVMSNEVDERQSAFLAKGIQKDTGEELPRVYVAPSMCKDQEAEEDDPCAADTICEPSPSGKRFYDIQVTAKDGASGQTAQDTCRVIVLPKRSQEGELRGGNAEQLTEQEQRELVEASPVMTVVGTLSLQNQNNFT